MYEFATIALLGLVVAKVVDLVGHVRGVSRTARAILAVVLGLAITWATDYSAFAGWGIGFRSLWMGPVATGLAIAGMAALWHEVLGVLRSYARHTGDHATETETKVTRVA